MVSYYFKILDCTQETIESKQRKFSDDNDELLEYFSQDPTIFSNAKHHIRVSDVKYLINANRISEFKNFLKNCDLIFDIDLMIDALLWANYAYFESVQFVQDPIVKDLDKIPDDFRLLSNILNNAEKISKLEMISFKFSDGTIPIRNHFLLADILDSLKSTFSSVNEHVNYKMQILVEKIEFAIVNDLFKYINELNPQKSNRTIYRFIGEFLNHAQIPSTKRHDLIEVDESQIYKLHKGKDILK